MALIDTSVWIDYFNGHENAATSKLDELLSSTIVVVGDLILAEVLQGFRSDTDHRTARNLLMNLDVRVLGGITVALKAADNSRTLRTKGVTVRKTVDCVIATYCMEHNIQLLHNDRDFDAFEKHLGLRVIAIAQAR